MTDQNSDIQENNFKEIFKKRIKNYVLSLIHFIEKLPPATASKIIGNQLIRSGTSIGANYFEARSASSRNDFINFLTHSLKSANESKFWFETLIDSRKCDPTEANLLLQETEEIGKILAASILTLKGKRKKF